MPSPLADIYSTRTAQSDAVYRGWLTELNAWALMQTGASIYVHTTLTPARLRRWYLSGMSAQDAMKRAQRAPRPRR